jgi:hypothetical protein
MLKVLAVLALFFLSVGLIILLSITFFTYFILAVEKSCLWLKNLKVETMEAYIDRTQSRFGGRLISNRIKYTWRLDEIYLIPCPVPVRFQIRRNAFVSTYLIQRKLQLLKYQ